MVLINQPDLLEMSPAEQQRGPPLPFRCLGSSFPRWLRWLVGVDCQGDLLRQPIDPQGETICQLMSYKLTVPNDFWLLEIRGEESQRSGDAVEIGGGGIHEREAVRSTEEGRERAVRASSSKFFQCGAELVKNLFDLVGYEGLAAAEDKAYGVVEDDAEAVQGNDGLGVDTPAERGPPGP